MNNLLIALCMWMCSVTLAHADVSVGIGLPGISIGVNVPSYPALVPVPGYPVYYDPRANSNYFFYDGMYWIYEGDNWYASSWYNGPWQLTEPDYVPLFVLRIPIRYYRHPPEYFHGWRADGPPHWGEHWGRGWEEHRSGWDHWDRGSAPRAAPLPAYQRSYSGEHYPRAQEQQRSIQSDHYRYQPREQATQQHFQQQNNVNRERPEQKMQSPVQQRPSSQDRVQPNQQRQPQQIQQTQHPQAEPQDRSNGNKPESHGNDRGNQGHNNKDESHRDQGRNDENRGRDH